MLGKVYATDGFYLNLGDWFEVWLTDFV